MILFFPNSVGYGACAGVGDTNGEDSLVTIGNCSCNYSAENKQESACYRLGEYKTLPTSVEDMAWPTSVGDMSWYVAAVV